MVTESAKRFEQAIELSQRSDNPLADLSLDSLVVNDLQVLELARFFNPPEHAALRSSMSLNDTTDDARKIN